MRIGSVLEIWRFPVKSMGGERVASTTIGEHGVHGDRLWAIRDLEKNVLTSAKRIPALLQLRARFLAEPSADVAPGSIPPVEITFPDGTTIASTAADVDARLSDFLGRKVTLCSLRDASDKDFYKGVSSTAAEMRESFAVDEGESLPDLSMIPLAKLAELGRYATPPGTFFDAMPLHVITTASLGTFDRRRFRANFVVETIESSGYLENSWTGATLGIGTATAFVDCPTPRCSMPTRAQPDLPADKSVLKTIARDADRCLGAYATVTKPGSVRTGDDVTLDAPDTSKL